MKVASAPKRMARSGVFNTSSIPEYPHFQAYGPAIERHYVLTDLIGQAWREKNRTRIVMLCREQISIGDEVQTLLREEAVRNNTYALGCNFGHPGFERLAMLYEKEGNFLEAIRVCEAGIAKGWSVYELSHREERCRKKLAKM